MTMVSWKLQDTHPHILHAYSIVTTEVLKDKPNQQQSTAHWPHRDCLTRPNKAEVRYVRQFIPDSRLQIHKHGVLA